jgi:putative ABC transport system permease protein
MLSSVSLAAASLRHRRFRIGLLIASLAISYALIAMASSTIADMRTAIAGFANSRLQVSAYYGGNLPVAHAKKIQSLVAPAETDWALYDGGSDTGDLINFMMMASTPGYLGSFPSSVLRVSAESLASWKDEKQGVLVSADVMRSLHWKIGDLVTIKTAYGNTQVRVSGVLDGTIKTVVAMHYEFLDALLPREAQGHVKNVLVHAERSTFGDMEKKILGAFEDSDRPVLVVPQQAYMELLLTNGNVVPQLLGMLSVIFAIITFFIVESTVYVSVRERLREFGTLRAIGFSRTRVFTLLVGESALVSIGAAVIGVGLTYLSFAMGFATNGALAAISLNGSVCLLVLLGSAFVGLLIALLPATLIARMDPSAMLSH